jgi:hypothetical protein
MTQQQALSVLPKAELMTAATQPTPAVTVMASVGQFLAQAPHSIQASRNSIRAFPVAKPRTALGQTSMQVPQPIHFPGLKSKVTTFFK